MLSFEIRERDVLGRIGILETKRGKLETPALFPVVNPLAQEIPPRTMFEELGSKAVITNAYLIKRRPEGTNAIDIHDFLDFPGIVATDSGAYQILQYGGVDVTPLEIVQYQESINTDIGVILDVPTGSRASKARALETVEETIRRADQAQAVITRRDIAWVGPIQGGLFPDLVAHSAREMSKRQFPIYALGSPTEVMEQYLFSCLVDMIFAAKTNLPSSVPFHLFGAGHPFMFALAVALGCDLFDSAAYILCARRGRYLTDAGTLELARMRHFPCNCRACAATSPDVVRSRPVADRIRFLAEHNLLSCLREIEVVKEAIVEGRLWELVEVRCRSHPDLLAGLRRTGEYPIQLAGASPTTKTKGIFFFDSTSLQRPEYLTYIERLIRDYIPPKAARTLLLLPAGPQRAQETHCTSASRWRFGADTHVCVYTPPYGLVPLELKDTFPLSHSTTVVEPGAEMLRAMSETVRKYVARHKAYRGLILVISGRRWQTRFATMCESICKKARIRLSIRSESDVRNTRAKTRKDNSLPSVSSRRQRIRKS